MDVRVFAFDQQDELQRRDEQAREAAAERAALRRDLERILKERGSLDSMRRLVATVVASSSTAAASAGAPGQAGVRAAS